MKPHCARIITDPFIIQAECDFKVYFAFHMTYRIHCFAAKWWHQRWINKNFHWMLRILLRCANEKIIICGKRERARLIPISRLIHVNVWFTAYKRFNKMKSCVLPRTCLMCEQLYYMYCNMNRIKYTKIDHDT